MRGYRPALRLLAACGLFGLLLLTAAGGEPSGATKTTLPIVAGQHIVVADLPGGGPVRWFRLSGIEAGTSFDAGDPQGFVAALSFDGAAMVDFTLRALTEPPAAAVFDDGFENQPSCQP